MTCLNYALRVRMPVVTVLTMMFGTVAWGQQFQDQTNTRFPNGPHEYTNQMSVGDIDGDGDLDILFANGGNFSSAGTPQQLRVYINNGAGVFTDESVTRLPAGSLFLARGVELGDVNGDGLLDIIVAQDFNRQPQLFINNPGNPGHFTNETASRLPVMLLSSSRGQFADVDNDGDLDIYLVNGGATSRFGTAKGRLWINDGTGIFTDQTDARMPNQTVVSPSDCIFGDIDGNFSLDLIIASVSSSASATNAKRYMNNGAGVFVSASMPSTRNNYSFDLGDIDGDGDLDLLGANAHPTSNNSELLARNNGIGAYTAIAFPTLSVDDNDSKFFDYDNDGDLDLIVGSLGSTERVYNNNGNGVFTLVSGVIQAISNSTLDIEVADFDGDGRLDVVTGQGESQSPYVNRIYMNVTGPVDTRAPRIIRTEQVADSLSADGPWHVRTVVYDDMTSDRGFHNKGVFLNYSVQRGAPIQVPMKWVGNSMWRGTIPSQPTGSVVEYFVTARDFANNLGTGDSKFFNVLWPPCPGDTNDDHVVNANDLLAVINGWGPSTPVTHHVNVADFSYSPSSLKDVKSGDTVQWNWVSGIHTVTSGTDCAGDGLFSSAISSATPTFSYVIPTNFSGDIPYFCMPHCGTGMVGNIAVAGIPGDVNGDGVVNANDLLLVINSWGQCPTK